MEHLPVPDLTASWQKMQSILDAEMPLAKKKRPTISKWWIAGIAILLIGGITYTAISPVNTPKPLAIEVIESTTTFPESIPEKNHIDTEKKAVKEKKDNVPSLHSDRIDNEVIANSNSNSLAAKKPNSDGVIHKNDIVNHDDSKGKDVFSGFNATLSQPPLVQHKQVLKKSTPKLSESNAAVGNLQSPIAKGEAQPEDKTSTFKYSKSATTISSTSTSVPVENLLYTDRRSIYHTVKPTLFYKQPENTVAQKAALKQLKKQQRKDERDMARSYSTSRSLWGEQPDRWFAAGIAPFQNVSLGDQKTYNYGASATRNMVTDYIPAPYLQIHLTNRVYVQSEFQFNAPQSTPALLLDQRTLMTPTIATLEQNTFLRKLYYFHMPVSFYYSPVKNFYLGSGLQFSSLSSGLATVEQMNPNNTQLHSETITLKDDALSGRLRGSEWRYLLDANYNINRFAFGVRYSQALNNYIDQKAINNQPAIQARNQAVQLYMRYNIIVSDKRR